MRLRKAAVRSSAVGFTQSQRMPVLGERHQYVAWSLGQVCRAWHQLRCADAALAVRPRIRADAVTKAATAAAPTSLFISPPLGDPTARQKSQPEGQTSIGRVAHSAGESAQCRSRPESERQVTYGSGTLPRAGWNRGR